MTKPLREIKFRAWYGTDIPAWKPKGMVYDPSLYQSELSYSNYGKEYWAHLNNVIEKLKDVGILMQYTGLKDKNGKEIYEGDVVRIEETYIGDSIIAKHNASIIFDLGSFNVNHSNACFDTLAVNHIYWEVIGNIYENPELLNKD